MNTSPSVKSLSIREVSVQLGVNYRTIYRMVASGIINADKVGWAYRISVDELHRQFPSHYSEVK
jgi:excisionase family DNA binding protein